MAGSNNFLVFDANAQNMTDDTNYASSTKRLNGVTSGLADSNLHNKLFRQSTIMAAAIGEVIKSKGLAASDADLTALTNVIKAVFTDPVGTLANLPTTVKSDLVSAITELYNYTVPSYSVYRDINGAVVFDTTELGHDNTEFSTDTQAWTNTGKKIVADMRNAWFLKVNIEAGIFPTGSPSSEQGVTYSFRLQLDDGTVIAQSQIDLATSGAWAFPNTYASKTAFFDLTKVSFTRAANQNLNLWVYNDNPYYSTFGWHPLKVRAVNAFKNQMVKVYDYVR